MLLEIQLQKETLTIDTYVITGETVALAGFITYEVLRAKGVLK